MTPELVLAASCLTGFVSVVLAGPKAIKYLASSGIYGVDQQKPEKPKVPTSGGILVLFGFMFSVTLFLGLSQLLNVNSFNVTVLLASLCSITLIALIGLIDDIHVPRDEEIIIETPDHFFYAFIEDVGSADEEHEDIDRQGLSQFFKMLFVLPAVLPLIAVGAGSPSMTLPLLGTVNWGLIYPLVLLPVGLLFVANVVNMLAGMNGLSSGLSIVAGSALGVFALLNGEIEAAVIGFSLASTLLGFLVFNWYPASLLPGDSLTYLSGAALFSAMVVGNMERFGVFIFVPWIVEFFLKLRSGFNAHSWGNLVDGKLKPQHEKNYSLTIPLMKKGLNEKQITVTLIGLEAVFCVSGVLLFSLVL